MANISRFSTVIALGLLSFAAGCSSEQAQSAEGAALTAEQACLKTHTDKGKLDFGGKSCQVCGAGRHEFAASLKAGHSISLPKAKLGLSFDLNLVAVRLTDHIGGFIELKRVASGSACGSSQSWQFDNDKDPGEIKLCNCETKQVSVDSAVYVDLLVGCNEKAGASGPTSDPAVSAQGGANSTATTTSNTVAGSASAPATTTTATKPSTGTCTTCSDDEQDDDDDAACSDDKCAASCSSGSCGSWGGVQVGGGIQLGGSIQIGGGVAASTTTKTEPAAVNATATATATASTSASGCNCLWNVLFSVNGCTSS